MKHRQIGISFITAAFVVAAASAHAATTWNVPGTGSNVCTVANPNCNTIAQAVTVSSSGDTILIGSGSFAAAAIALTKTLTIAGAGIGSTFVQPTTTAFSVRTSGIVLRDFTLQNGTAGISFQSAASNNTQITRVAFSGQTARGIDIQLAATFPVTNVTIADCSFATAAAATAIRTSSTAQVAGLTITGTSVTGSLYGLYVANDSSTSKFSGLTIQNSTFTNNANYAIYAEEMRDAVIEDSTFTGGSVGIGIFKFYGSNGVAASNVTIRRNVFSAFKANALDLEVYLGGATPGVGLEAPITIEDNTIQKNVAISTSSATVFVRLPPALTNATVNILNNDIVASGTFTSGTRVHAIQLRGNGPVSITGNVLDGGSVGGSGTTPPSSGIFVESQSASTGLPSGTFSNVMPATVSISASCNRIQGFRNAVSVFDSIANVYGGLQVGASVTLASNAILGNDDGVVTAAAPPTIAADGNYWGCPAGPTDVACDDVVGNVDASSFLPVIAACVPCIANSECDDGLFCSGAETCNVGSGACVVGSDPCAGGPACGNVCNEATDDCFVAAGTVCRAAAGTCDVAETCSGAGGACPADVLVSAGTECRAAAGVCDAAEACDGASPSCPPDALVASGTTCRAAAGPCDIAEACTGSGPACPGDAKQSSGTGCADDGNPCSLDQCDGSADACQHPAGNAGAPCRTAAGVCDVAENCDGANTVCPPDAKSSAVCRPSAGICDVAESCNGVTDTCPADAFQPSSTVCRGAAGACDVAESCTGAGAACPADALVPSGTVCRATAGACDVAETCSGSNPACPADALAASGTVCRASAGACDLAETCTGAGAACPADAKSSAVCRPAAGVCDVAESCDGAGNACPPNAFRPSSVVCRAAASPCDLAESCTGTSAACPADAVSVDGDGDGICDAEDDCPLNADPGQVDGDSDGVGDACDNCAAAANADQADLDGDAAGNVCDPDDAGLNPTKMRFKVSTGANDASNITIKGDFVVLDPGDVFTASAGITVTAHDGKPTPTVRSRTFPASECLSAGTRISCKSVDRLAKAKFRTSTNANGVWKFSAKLKKQSLVSPLVGPATAIVTYGPAIDRVGSIEDCIVSFTSLNCRQQH